MNKEEAVLTDKPVAGQPGSWQRFILPNILLAGIYALTGYLGLLLAIPPSYATAVWPASGFALAGLLLFGKHLWPGVLLGSVLISIKTSFDPATTETMVRSSILTIIIGSGAALQALAGYYLIKRRVNLDHGLVLGRDVNWFLGMGGPVSCLISASWGVTTLWLFGLIDDGEYPYSWMTWWVGDTTGVLLMLPLIFVFCGRPKELWVQRRLRVALPMIVMLAATVIIFLIASHQVQGRIESEFRAKALALDDSLERTIIRNTEVLYSVHGLFNISEAVSFSQFQSYAGRALDRNPGVKALSWSAVVSAQQRSEFINNIQAQGFPDFEFTELDASGQLVRAATRESYAVVSYVVPTAQNRNVIGFDSYSDPPGSMRWIWRGQQVGWSLPMPSNWYRIREKELACY